MAEKLQREDETLEDLQLGGLKLLQKKNGFRFGMDSVLLADFALIRPNDLVVDFGTGGGILLLLLIGRGKGERFFGIEIQPDYCEMAERTMKINHLESQVTICCEDAGNADRLFQPCSVDAIICNPPYGEPGTGLESPFSDRAVARNQSENTLISFMKAAFRILKGKGKIHVIYPAAQMFQMMTAMKACHIEPKHFRLIYPRMTSPANLVMIEGVKDAKPGLHPMKPLIIFEENQDLTNELKSIYHIQEQNLV
ncbi:MAG: methyltransferase [Clostridia bacterium]|nr:methyltransferase [Clostridia bacterium]